MNHTNRFTSLRSRGYKLLAAAALTVACGGHTERANAGLPVIDYTAIVNAFQNYTDQYERWIKTAQHYQEVMQHYADQATFWQTQLNKLQHLNFALFTLKHQFQEVDENFGADVECPGAAISGGLAGVLDRALSTLIPSMDGDVISQQQGICVLIVQAKNAKYNDTVRYLTYVQTKAAELAKAQGELVPKLSQDTGNATGFIAQIGEFGQTLEAARAQWESNQRQADAQIDMLLTMQATLSRRAMNGKPNVIGTLVNAAALKAAFE
jgi:hypothetical protein